MAALGPALAFAVEAGPLPEPHWVARSEALAAEMGLGAWLDGDEALQTLAGNRRPGGPTPLATVYSGHQFGVWAGQLGDGPRDLFLDRPAFDAWGARYAERLRSGASSDEKRAQRMNAVNPKFVLRNHLAETAIRAADEGDFSETQRLLKVLEHPFDEQPDDAAYAAFSPDWAQHLEVSCSS